MNKTVLILILCRRIVIANLLINFVSCLFLSLSLSLSLEMIKLKVNLMSSCSDHAF